LSCSARAMNGCGWPSCNRWCTPAVSTHTDRHTQAPTKWERNVCLGSWQHAPFRSNNKPAALVRTPAGMRMVLGQHTPAHMYTSAQHTGQNTTTQHTTAQHTILRRNCSAVGAADNAASWGGQHTHSQLQPIKHRDSS
jgi:hypothetical protein